jgi:hypothetical protein
MLSVMVEKYSHLAFNVDLPGTRVLLPTWQSRAGDCRVAVPLACHHYSTCCGWYVGHRR